MLVCFKSEYKLGQENKTRLEDKDVMLEILHNKCTSTIRWRIAASGGDDACAAWLEHRRRVQCSSTAWSEWSVVTWQCIMATNPAPRWIERHDVKTGECEANGISSDQSDSGWLWNRWMSLTVVRVRVAWVRAGPPAVSTLCRLAPPPHPLSWAVQLRHVYDLVWYRLVSLLRVPVSLIR